MFALLRTGLLSAAFLLLAPALVHSAVLGNPGDGQTYSGIGAISGWKCTAGRISIRFNDSDLPEMTIPLAYGTVRPDVASKDLCQGHEDVGFVALYNWAKLGNGTHTAVVYDDGVEFARSTFTVGSTGREFVLGASASVTVPDFPRPGANQEFEWNQSTQHMEMVSPDRTPVDGVGSQSPEAFLGNPTHGLNYSGIGVVSGWKCYAGRLEYSVDGGTLIPMVWRMDRKDVRDDGLCSRRDVGFVAIQNWANFGAGEHTLVAYDDGVEFARSTFTVGHPTVGGVYIEEVSAQVTVGGIPSSGMSAEFEWNQNTQHLEMVCQHNCSDTGNGSGPPSFGEATIADQSYTPNTAITSLTLPQATGGTAPLVYSLSPALPAGLSFNQTTRELSGTPTSTLNATTYTYTVTDGSGATATLTFSLTVSAQTPSLSFGSATIAEQIHAQNAAIPSLTLPQATGGTPPLTYSLSPALPAGLSFDPTTRELSGTPTSTLDATTYTYTATDATGATAVLSFRMLVTPPLEEPLEETDDHQGNSTCSSGATRLYLGSSRAGEFETVGDIDCFRIVVPTSGSGSALIIWTTGDTDTEGHIFFASRDVTDDDHGLGYNFQIVERVSAGTFYVKVNELGNNSVGSYRIRARLDHSDSRSHSGSTLYDLVHRTSSEPIKGRLTSSTDIDWFKFSLPCTPCTADVEIWTTDASGGDTTDTYGYLYGAEWIAEDDDSGFFGSNDNFRIEETLPQTGPGYYFVGVRGYNGATGAYNLYIRYQRRN